MVARVHVSLDERLLKQIDRRAKSRALSRSAYLADLAARDLGSDRGPGADPRVGRAHSRLNELFERNPTGGDSTAIIREMRDSL